MASLIFNVGLLGICEGTVDWENDTTIRCLLTKGAGTPIKTNATVLAALAEANVDEIGATGYSRGTIGTPAVTNSAGKILFSSADQDFGALGNGTNETITGILFYKGTTSAGDDAANVPIAYATLSSSLLTNSGTVLVTPNATNKWFYIDNT